MKETIRALLIGMVLGLVPLVGFAGGKTGAGGAGEYGQIFTPAAFSFSNLSQTYSDLINATGANAIRRTAYSNARRARYSARNAARRDRSDARYAARGGARDVRDAANVAADTARDAAYLAANTARDAANVAADTARRAAIAAPLTAYVTGLVTSLGGLSGSTVTNGITRSPIIRNSDGGLYRMTVNPATNEVIVYSLTEVGGAETQVQAQTFT